MPISICGTGSAVPGRILSNQDLSGIVDTTDDWIVSRTGIRERRISEGQGTADLASAASARAMESASVGPDEIDLVVCATVSPDQFTPTVSCQVQKTLGLAKATCFDLWAGCTGFVFALMTAHSLMSTAGFGRALVIGSEVLTKLTDWSDRNTCVLFGDGAGAVVLARGIDKGILGHVSGSDGARGDVLTIDGVCLHNVACAPDPSGIGDGGRSHVIKMDGAEVFRFAVAALERSVTDVLNGVGLPLDQVDYIVPHQANNRIIDHVAGRMGLPREKFYTNLDRYGNTSSASIPIALDEMNRRGLLSPGMNIVTVGFGGGLTWGANLIRWTIS